MWSRAVKDTGEEARRQIRRCRRCASTSGGGLDRIGLDSSYTTRDTAGGCVVVAPVLRGFLASVGAHMVEMHRRMRRVEDHEALDPVRVRR